MSSDPIVKFYRGEGPDSQGRRIEEIWQLKKSQLENANEDIEWLFPLTDGTRTEDEEPIVRAETVEAFAADASLRERLRHSLDVMLSFYGLTRDDGTIARGETFESRRLGWLYPDDPNHRRLSRIVRSLALLGEPELAESLRDELVAIADDYGAHSVSRETRTYWARALEM